MNLTVDADPHPLRAAPVARTVVNGRVDRMAAITIRRNHRGGVLNMPRLLPWRASTWLGRTLRRSLWPVTGSTENRVRNVELGYAPVMAPTEDGAVDGGTVTDAAKWELLEVLAGVILAAEAIRILGSVVAGLIYGLATKAGVVPGQRIAGNALEMAAGFADGPGIVLLLISLGLVWWRAQHWAGRLESSLAKHGSDGGEPDEAVQLRRLWRLAAVATGLLLLGAVGALVFVVGDGLVTTAGGLSSSAQWEAFANAWFPVAYIVIALCGALAARRLSAQCEAWLAQLSTG
jgi:hypothetical protein